MTPLNQIVSRESPREILADDYKTMGGVLPIRGGWGYTQSDACVIDKNDVIVDRAVPFNGVAVEYSFIEKRIWEEMIIFRKEDERFAGIEWKLLKQSLISGDDGRVYDKLEFEITALPKNAWAAMKAEWEGPNGFNHPAFDLVAHDQKRERHKIKITREFWFDITSFFKK